MADTMHPYSVLLLYPAYLNDDGERAPETYYTHVLAPDAEAAVAMARAEATQANGHAVTDPTDFVALLVLAGHHTAEPVA